MDAPKKSEMLCYSCMYSIALTHMRMECRLTPSFNTKDAGDWCSKGMWRIFSQKYECWVYFYFHEGIDD